MKVNSITPTALFSAGLVLAAVILGPLRADAAGLGGDANAGFISLGGRGTYFKATDADRGDGFGGGQLRFHLGPALAIEGSADYRKTDAGAAAHLDVFPVQVSLLGYLLPGSRLSPFLLGGAGWYFTRIKGPNNLDDTKNRFGLHAGGGVQIFLNSYWSVDGTYRYVWVEKVASRGADVLDKDFEDSGHMVTAALNFHFPAR